MSVIVGGAVVGFHMINTGHYFVQLYLYNKKNKELGDPTTPNAKKIQIVSTITIIGFTYLIILYYLTLNNGNLNLFSHSTIVDIITPLILFPFLFSYTLLLLFHFLRLKTIFENSVYSVNNRFIKIVKNVIIFELIIDVLVLLSYVIFIHLAPSVSYIIEALFVPLIWLLEIIFEILILFSFNSKLLSLVTESIEKNAIRKAKKRMSEISKTHTNTSNKYYLPKLSANNSSNKSFTNTHSNISNISNNLSNNASNTYNSNRNDLNMNNNNSNNSNNSNNNSNNKKNVNKESIDIDLNRIQTDLLVVATKQTMLLTTSVIATLFIIIFGFLGTLLSIVGVMYISLCYLFGFLIICMSIWLSFSFADKTYLFYCKLCNYCCLGICRKIAKTRIKEKIKIAVRDVRTRTISAIQAFSPRSTPRPPSAPQVTPNPITNNNHNNNNNKNDKNDKNMGKEKSSHARNDSMNVINAAKGKGSLHIVNDTEDDVLTDNEEATIDTYQTYDDSIMLDMTKIQKHRHSRGHGLFANNKSRNNNNNNNNGNNGSHPTHMPVTSNSNTLELTVQAEVLPPNRDQSSQKLSIHTRESSRSYDVIHNTLDLASD